MESGSLILENTDAHYSVLRDRNGNWLQFWYAVRPQEVLPIAVQLNKIAEVERALRDNFGIKPQDVALRRFFSSDLISHLPAYQDFKITQPDDFFLSLIDQAPAPSAKAALLAMALPNITERHRDGEVFYFRTSSGVTHIFLQGLVDPNANDNTDAEEQTAAIFSLLEKKLEPFGATTEANVLRTWIYAPNVDADYPGIVRARKAHFDKINLTEKTHYTASTGIQGSTGNRFARVSMDAYAVTSLNGPRVRYLSAPEHLGPTHVYGVTFERATAIELGETDFLFISGTASIDVPGNVVHPGDVVGQTKRTLENITGLLTAGGFGVEDLSSLIVYLRDPTDFGFVKPVIEALVGPLPVIYVKAAVCRPAWLIEIEATAAKLIGLT
ncbi:MAG: hypothetical protein IT291_04775 [Deltaproteobacteria bacterium]|nr:hypothetical protein [Deltaproteobacteria bacterium]